MCSSISGRMAPKPINFRRLFAPSTLQRFPPLPSPFLCFFLLQVPYVPEGMEALVFTADGDMRQALNNLQATVSGFKMVNQGNVFKVQTKNGRMGLSAH